jgi:hypothetical protein
MARKRGRPPFKPTTAIRRKVEELIACGKSQDVIASAIGCARDTLTKHFADELLHGRARREAEANALLWKNARKGNASALRRLLDEIRVAGAASDFEKPPAPAPKLEKLGKKAAAAEAAQHVGGEGSEWGEDLRAPDRPLN